MKVRAFGILLTALLLPSIAVASTVRTDESLTVSETPPGNAYYAAADILIDAPVIGDLIAAGNQITIAAPVDGDILSAGAALRITAPVAGDVRVAGAQITISEAVEGEVAAFGGSIRILGNAREVRVAGASVEVTGGAAGPVTIYASRVTLAGEFADNVRVVAADQVTLLPGTVINGTLEYNAPQEATIPADATVVGGARYIGTASFLPTTEEAKTFAIAGVGVFFIVRVLAAMVTAGLLAGLFPAFSRRIVSEALGQRPQHFMFLFLVGFATLILTPIIFLLLIASIVGIGIAFLIGSAYLFLLFLAYLYAALLAGAGLDRLIRKRTSVSWHHAVVGMLALFVVGFIPGIGFLVTLVLMCVSLGAVLRILYIFAFPKGELHG